MHVQTKVLQAADRYDIGAFVNVRKALEAEAEAVVVRFADGSADVRFTREDLPAIRRKILYCI